MNLFKLLSSKISIFVGLLMGQLFLANIALAQAFAAPAASDMSRQFLNQIFGALLDGGSDAFGDAIATFNGAILIVGGILAAYTILTGTLSTAHDGEMLGKKFSSVYIPIRYGLGTALVLPIIGGYCLMQVLVMWIVMQGVSLGNMAWTSYMANPPALAIKISPTSKEKYKKFVEDAYMAQVCVVSKRIAYGGQPQDFQQSDPNGFSTGVSSKLNDFSATAKGNVWEFGDAGDPALNTMCGTITELRAPTVKENKAATSSLSSLTGLEAIFKSPPTQAVYETQTREIRKIIEETGKLAEKAVQNKNSVTYAELESLYNNYITAITNSAKSLENTTDTTGMAAAANNQGWFMAGSWITQLIIAQNKINAVVNAAPMASIKAHTLKSVYSDEAKRLAINGYSVLAPKRSDAAALSRELSSPSGTSDSNEGKTTDTGGTDDIAKMLSSMVTGIDIEEVKTDQRHPLIMMTQVGDSIFSAIMSMMGVAAGLAALGSVTVAGFGVNTVPTLITFFGALAFPLAGFIGVAAMLSYILPNLPFLIWLGIIIGWTIMVIEAVIAAPLWAVMHLHPNGDDLTGRGGNGYMLILGLLLRPVLIIFGLIAAIVLSGLFGQLLNRVFFDIFSSNVGDDGLGFFAILFGLGIYTGAMFMVIKQTFNLVHVIPDQLMRWIGGGGEQLGQYAGGFSGEGMAKASAIGGAAAGYVAKDAVSSLGSGLSQFGQLKAAKAGAAAQKAGNQIAEEAKQQDKQIAENNSYAAADSAFGPGAGELKEQINDKERGSTTVGAMSGNRLVEQAQNTLGPHSQAASDYRARVSEGISSGQTTKEAHSDAFQKTIDEKYGNGAFETANRLSNDNPLQFKRALGSFEEKLEGFKTAGLSSENAKETMSGIFQNVNSSADVGNSANVWKSSYSEANSKLGIEKSQSLTNTQSELKSEPVVDSAPKGKDDKEPD